MLGADFQGDSVGSWLKFVCEILRENLNHATCMMYETSQTGQGVCQWRQTKDQGPNSTDVKLITQMYWNNNTETHS